ncbi:Uncharacterised protein [Yersinia aldovae]|nr:Uncharacterised protein [Yersinia aldovae]
MQVILAPVGDSFGDCPRFFMLSYYDWLQHKLSNRKQGDERLMRAENQG